MKDQELLEQISKKFSALLTLSLLSGPEKCTLSEKVALLSRFGLSNAEVAEILGTTKSTVGVLKSRIKKGNK